MYYRDRCIDSNQASWIKQSVDIMEISEGDNYKYPNFYVDLSYLFIKDYKTEFLWLLKNHPIVKDRLLFGSDWYMIENSGVPLPDFITDAKPAIDEISKKLTEHTGIRENLWTTFTRTNPMKFFNIRSIAKNFEKGLHKAKEDYSDALKKDHDMGKLEIDELLVKDKASIKNKLEIIENSDIY